MTRDEADACQEWAGMDGGTAFLWIERHANDHQEVQVMMEAWARARYAEDLKIALLEEGWNHYE